MARAFNAKMHLVQELFETWYFCQEEKQE